MGRYEAQWGGGASTTIINCLKNVISLVRGRSCVVCNWRGEKLNPGAWCYTLSQCAPCLTVPIQGTHKSTSIYQVPEARHSPGVQEKMRHGLGFLEPPSGRKTTQKHWTLMLTFVVLLWRLSFDSTHWQGGPTTLCFNLILSLGFLNKWMFCGRVWSIQALESGKSGFRSWLFYFIAVGPWAIDSVCLGHMFLLGKSGDTKT